MNTGPHMNETVDNQAALESRLFLDAINIHTGGGAVLLDGLLASDFGFGSTILIVDRRYEPPDGWPLGLTVRRVEPSLLGRVRASRWIARSTRPDDDLVCLGNLPPLFRVPCRTALFIQNRYLLDRSSLARFPLPIATRLRVERLWLRFRSAAIHRFAVQTASMRRLLESSSLASGRPISVLPFMAEMVSPNCEQISATGGAGFIYVASGEPHKNHKVLLDAWRLLAGEGLFPKLLLTVDTQRFPALARAIVDGKSRDGLDIANLETLGRNDLAIEYSKAAALIYPSLLESFGMPLIEAQQWGLPIIAPELDYVRDVVVPTETFDASSALSLARAVKRFLGRPEQPARPLDPGSFLLQLVGKAE